MGSSTKVAIQLGTAVWILMLAALQAAAQETPRSGRLYDDAAFVDCDQAKFGSIFTDDAEFYHDRAGPSYGESVKRLRSCPKDDGVTRTLVPGSLEVYPIKDFGAVQMGRHTFIRKGQQGAEIAKFVHLWNYSEGKWRLSRVLSFDHRAMTDQDRAASDAGY